MLWFEVYPFPAEFGSCMVSLLALPFPNGGSLGGMLWFEVYPFPAELGSCMVSLPAFPFPNGGSLGGTLCAVAPAANTEANATAKIIFFTIFSVVFRGQQDGATRGLNPCSYHRSGPADARILLRFITGSSVSRRSGEAVKAGGCLTQGDRRTAKIKSAKWAEAEQVEQIADCRAVHRNIRIVREGQSVLGSCHGCDT
jgi:hypothetical protein